MSPTPPSPPAPPSTVRAAGTLVCVQGLAAIGFATFLVVVVGAGALGLNVVLAEAAFYALVGAAVVALGVGLLRGRLWARTPAVVVQILLLAVAYSLVASGAALLGVAVGVAVLVVLGLLLSPPTRRWSEDLDQARRR
ncbi:MAG TPA: hypothetical protein VGM60_20535 [Pseudonocardia sp.]|uniref:hypothetical protein n=1 Tax=Pseudonocardia sp. TaxID=60912 RepID=UPI002F413118